MASILYKWLFVFALTCFSSRDHPIFVSVTEIEHNAPNKVLEISCKIFTDDFETILRNKHKIKVDLLDASLKPAMNPIVNDYLQKHLVIVADGQPVRLEFLGFEQEEEGIICFFEVKNIVRVKRIEVLNDILYENNKQQMGIIHVMVKGARKSSRLNNPDAKVSFEF